jgi:histo-blood group ABO system transferase
MTVEDPNSNLPSIGVMTVATNRYINYWAEMAASADRHLFPGHRLVLHVFTDQVERAREIAASLTRVEVDVLPIEPLGWPEATLLRYEIFDTHRERLTEDILIHLDADMLIVHDTGAELRPDQWRGGIALVRHPGYRRPGPMGRLSLYGRHPRKALSDVRARMVMGGIGSWETDTRSRAFVAKPDRRVYVCGGTWMGQHDALISLVHELAQRTRNDLDEGTIAVWHDESHLNWYASRNGVTLLGSEYCYAPGYPSVADLTPLIIAVDKGDNRTR